MRWAEYKLKLVPAWILLVLVHLVVCVDHVLLLGACGVESHRAIPIVALDHKDTFGVLYLADITPSTLEISEVRVYLNSVSEVAIVPDWANPVDAENVCESLSSGVCDGSLSGIAKSTLNVVWKQRGPVLEDQASLAKPVFIDVLLQLLADEFSSIAALMDGNVATSAKDQVVVDLLLVVVMNNVGVFLEAYVTNSVAAIVHTVLLDFDSFQLFFKLQPE